MNMKKIKIFATLAALVAVLVSCSEILNEHPKTFYEPSYFNTEAGVEGGLTYMYRHLRNLYGGQNMLNFNAAGTDEYTWAESAEGNHKVADMNQGDTEWSGSNNPASSVWNNTFSNINTANGVIENGEANGVAASLLAEAYFFRAFDYFLLVQTYGGVPLDLGSGNLKFNAAPSTYSRRTPVDSVYEQCIFPDFEYALANLPERPRKTGAVTKTTARLFLAKAYLTYAWWNENPKGIDTYPPAAGRSASKAPGYFQKAYDMAMQGINNPGQYGLEDSFYDVWKGDNPYSKEYLLYADYFYGTGAQQYSSSLTGYAGGGAPDNTAFWMVNCNYTYFKVSDTGNPATVSGGTESFDSAVAAITRSGEQGYGRPWARMAPVQGVFTHTFADLRDSRLDVPVNMTYKQNYTRYNTTPDKPAKTIYGAAGQPMAEDAAVVKFIPNQAPGVVSYPSDRGSRAVGANGFAAGQMAGENSYVIEYNHIGRTNFPGPWKNSIVDLSDVNTEIGIIKTNNDPGQPNIGNPRPLVIARFSEFYFVAAEANLKGATAQGGQDAKALMSVIRARAGVWNHSVAEGTARKAKEIDPPINYGPELVAAMPSTITIDWLLDEYSREFFGEFRRWYDLVRTQTWIERAKTYEMGDRFNDGPTNAKTWTRNIPPHYYLRPIPTGQINALMMSEEELKAYQNPVYIN